MLLNLNIFVQSEHFINNCEWTEKRKKRDVYVKILRKPMEIFQLIGIPCQNSVLPI